MVKKIVRYVVLALVVVGIVFLMSTLLNDKKSDDNFSSGKTYTASIRVMDKETRKFITGGEFVLKTSTGEVVEEWIATENIKRVTNLKNGTYVLIQKSAADGYEVADEITFKIYNEGKDVTVYNQVISEEEVIDSEEVVVDNTLSVRSNFGYVISLVVVVFGILLIGKKSYALDK